VNGDKCLSMELSDRNDTHGTILTFILNKFDVQGPLCRPTSYSCTCAEHASGREKASHEVMRLLP
jgi:hypothetical protein